MQRIEIAALLALLVSTFVIVVELLAPANVNLVLDGQGQVVIRSVPHIYSLSNIILVTVAALTAGTSGSYLLLPHRTIYAPEIRSNAMQAPSEEKLASWQSARARLQDHDGGRIMELLIMKGGSAPQGELIAESGFSKSKVSVLLNDLENKGLLERKRKGMSNVVSLK